MAALSAATLYPALPVAALAALLAALAALSSASRARCPSTCAASNDPIWLAHAGRPG
tara:strand:- start:570 stop:740 length:171 start_codon:yes stop_codon:yes gene_type:complete